jgi:hypothetical protein
VEAGELDAVNAHDVALVRRLQGAVAALKALPGRSGESRGARPKEVLKGPTRRR